MAPLPNLTLRAVAVLVGLYTLLIVALIAVVEWLGLPIAWVLWSGIIIAALQFVFSPILMDWVLQHFYQMDWEELVPGSAGTSPSRTPMPRS